MSALLLAALALGQAGFGPFGSLGDPVTTEATFERPVAASERASEHVGSNPLYLAFDVYRLTITVFDGPRCVHRPTCSVYALRAVQRDGLAGVFLAIDRLWREDQSSALRLLPQVWDSGRPYLLDPLDGSDFWLHAR